MKLHDCVYCLGIRSAELTPNSSISVCPGEQIVIKCTELRNDAMILIWKILLNDRQLQEIELVTSSVAVNETSVYEACLLYTSPSPRDATLSRMPSSA